MLKMKYLWLAALVALCATLCVGSAYAQDHWAVATEYDEDAEEDVEIKDFPSAMVWDETATVSFEALNDGSTTWSLDYDFRSAEGVTPTLTAVDRWGLTYTPEGGITPPVAPDETYLCSFSIEAPPITTLAYTAPVGPTDPGAVADFDCDWTLANGGVLITDSGLAENDIAITSYPDDAPGSFGGWAGFFIEECAGRVPFIVLGYPDGLYRPRAVLGRDAMAVFMRRAMKIDQIAYGDVAEEDQLGDVGEGHWACGDVYALVDAEVVLGYPDGLYHPEFSISRAQMAVFVARAADYTLQRDEDGESTLMFDPFPDVPADSFWAAPEIWACARNGVVLGYTDGLYRPTTTVSRDQMAVYSYRAFIQSAANAVVLAGPATTNIDVLAAGYVGVTSETDSPLYAYVGFDAMRLGADLAYGGSWDITFRFLEDAGPTLAGGAIVNVSPAEINAANAAAAASGVPYYFVQIPVPALATGAYTLVVLVEDETGTEYELPRTVAIDVMVPPPPPGPEGPFKADSLCDADWNTAAGMDDGRTYIDSGSFDATKDSDNMLLVLRRSPMVPHSENWNDSTVAWDLCCGETVLGTNADLGVSLCWNDIVIPTGATEMKITFEYRQDVGDFYCCNANPCSNVADGGQAWHGMGEPWDSEGAPMSWGAGIVDWGDAWALSTWGSEADLYKDHDYAGSFTDNEFARLPSVEETVVWTVPIADAAKYVDAGKVMLHICGGAWDYLYVDVAVVEFTIPTP